jgi:N-acetylneuraminate lyase
MSSASSFGLVAATFTAFDAAGTVNLAAIEQQAEVLTTQGLRGVFVCGTSGEFASLSVAERIAVAQRWSEVVGNDLELIVHVGHSSLPDARVLAAHAEEIGAAAIAAVGPYYFRPRGMSELVAFSAQIAAAAPRTPFFYYHIPSFTGVTGSMLEYMRAASATIPTFAGLKFTHENLAEYASCVAYEDNRYEIFFGRDEMLLGALPLGAHSGVGTTYNVAAPLYQRLYDAYTAGDLETARMWQNRAIAMVDVAVAHGGMPAFKAMMRFNGVDCGPSRLPLSSLDDAAMERLHEDLDQVGFFAAMQEASSGS